MSSFLKKPLQLLCGRTPLQQTLRYRGKINIQRPQKFHYEKALYWAVTQPKPPKPPRKRLCFETSKELYSKQEENPYELIIAREIRNWLQHSRTVAIFHLNSINADDLFKVRVQLHKQNFHLKDYGKKLITMAVKDTRYEAIIPLFDSYHCIIFSPEQRVSQLLRITRRVPQMVLMAGIVDDRLLSHNEFKMYAQLPSLPVAQAELVQTLNMAASNLVRVLETGQNNLVQVLDVHAKSERGAAEVLSETTEAVTDTITQTETAVPSTEGEQKEK